jgi:hypothetical protein
VNYGVLLLSVLFIHGFIFMDVLILNMFTLLFFFIIRFNLIIYKSKNALKYEEQN